MRDKKGRFTKGMIPHNYKGEKAGYGALHSRIYRHRGKPKECVYCGERKKSIQWASISHKANGDLNDYIPLCAKCHYKYDHINQRINKKVANTNKIGIRGVCYDNERKKWRVYVNLNGKQVYSHRFEHKTAAILASKWARKLIYEGGR